LLIPVPPPSPAVTERVPAEGDAAASTAVPTLAGRTARQRALTAVDGAE
jgi:hypothetical protein